MIVQCKKKIGNYPILVLPINIERSIDDTNCIISHEWYTIDAEISGYSITPDLSYRVYGFLCCNEMVRVLISDDNNIPGFFPLDLFDIIENELFFDWKIGTYQIKNGSLLTIVGYSELTSDYNHFRDLTNSVPSAIKIYLNQKEQREQW